MNLNFRTILAWLDEHSLSPDAEVWILTHDQVLPVTDFRAQDSGDIIVIGQDVWSVPPPTPTKYSDFYDYLIRNYAGGGTLVWHSISQTQKMTYRGSYVNNPENAVFLTFLPEYVNLAIPHKQRQKEREDQALELTRLVEASRTPLDMPLDI